MELDKVSKVEELKELNILMELLFTNFGLELFQKQANDKPLMYELQDQGILYSNQKESHFSIQRT